ncbi:extracellular solute-binding protein [Pseudoroseomonas cervicalis]|uniref:sn-glycerol-3-phosphate-binding periplasmic protein UgpB n=1 Tax=Pseudoroseomonas cervicalis ATCC 49957 TaxID=525371 RepID=D5RRH0_9PROT|nr:extracellular solute-binding protein [Pseudoroseomonas cervicalis]EFH10098.1 ABC transporter, solute-binding protein [Pseudoroseomonas cervicalis ATCC 49957]
MRKTGIAALAAGLAMALAAPQAEAQQRQRFTWWYGLTGQLGEVMQSYCKNFNAAQSEFEIVCTGQGDYAQALQNTIAAFRANEHPTIVQVYDVGTTDLMLSGQYIPARQLMSENGHQVAWDNYISSIGNYYATSRGEMLSFPFNSSTAVMYWNKGAYRAVGQENPPETWQQVERAARALKAQGHACPIAIDFDSWQHWEQFNAIHNLPMATQQNGFGGLNAEVKINDLFRRHANNLLNWHKEGLVQIRTPQNGGLVPAFAQGECAMTMGSIANHVAITRTARQGMEWGVGMLPLYEGHNRTNSMVGGASLWVLKGRPAAEYRGAAAFLAFIAQPEQELYMVQNTGYIPVTRSGYERIRASGFYGQPQNQGREMAMTSLLATEPTENSRGLRLGNFTQVRALYANEMAAAFGGQKTMDQALAAIETQANQLLRRFEQTYRGRQLP